MDSNEPEASFRTPQRGRSGYPAHLARAGEGPRVPLHRRGTSQKLECFDDLLREAGFKETRIFTPEAERAEAAAEARRKQAERKRNGGGDKGASGLVGFLSSLVPWSDTEEVGRKIEGRHSKTQSLGRVTGKQNQILLNGDQERAGTDGGADLLVTPTPNRRKPFSPVILASDFSSPGSSSSTSSRSPPHPHFKALQPASNATINKQLERARLDARTTLRHMISLPEFAPAQHPSRRALLRRATEKPNIERRQQTIRARQYTERSQLGMEREPVPPLPQNWLSTVAHAVKGASGTGARIGRPQTSLQGREPARSRSTRDPTHPFSDVQSLAEYTRRNGSLARRGFAPRTPRADTTPSVVTAASVVCRSAPGSRSSSVVRPNARGRLEGTARDTCLPCLGVASVQLAGSTHGGIEAEVTDVLSSQDTNHASVNNAEDDLYDDSSDEGELDFARLIVPARRQHSIQSLRRHLYNHAIASVVSGGRNAPPPSAYNRRPRRTDSQLSVGTQRVSHSRADVILDDPDDLLNSRRVSIDEDAEDALLADWAAQGLPGLQSAVHKKRGALPWAGRLHGS